MTSSGTPAVAPGFLLSAGIYGADDRMEFWVLLQPTTMFCPCVDATGSLLVATFCVSREYRGERSRIDWSKRISTIHPPHARGFRSWAMYVARFWAHAAVTNTPRVRTFLFLSIKLASAYVCSSGCVFLLLQTYFSTLLISGRPCICTPPPTPAV